MSNLKAPVGDLITSVSQKNHKYPEDSDYGDSPPSIFADIPEPPPGWNPEENPIFTEEVGIPKEHQILKKPEAKKKEEVRYLGKSRVFIVGTEGNPEYEELLNRGLSGQIILGKKEVLDIKDSLKFKVYLEWMEPSSV